jgi:hypothetical protein
MRKTRITTVNDVAKCFVVRKHKPDSGSYALANGEINVPAVIIPLNIQLVIITIQ